MRQAKKPLQLIQAFKNSYFYSDKLSIGVYFNQSKKTAVLIDSGLEDDTARKLNNLIKAQGYKVTAIINTHSHADHCGGNSFFQKENKDIQIFSTRIESHTIVDPTLESMCFCSGAEPLKALQTKFYQAKPSTVTTIIPSKDENLTIEGDTFKIIYLPGHTPGMIAVISPDGVFYSGDSIFGPETYGKHGVLFYSDIDSTMNSFKKIADLQVSKYVLYHGGLYEKDIITLINKHIEKINQVRSFIFNQILKNSATTIDKITEEVSKEFKIPDNTAQFFLTRTCVFAFITHFEKLQILSTNIKSGAMTFEVKPEKQLVVLPLLKAKKLELEITPDDKSEIISATTQSGVPLTEPAATIPEEKAKEVYTVLLPFATSAACVDFFIRFLEVKPNFKTIKFHTLEEKTENKIPSQSVCLMKAIEPKLVSQIVALPKSNLVAGACIDHVIRIWDLQTGTLTKTLTGHKNTVWGLAIINAKYLASCSYDTTICIWDWENGQLAHTLKGHTGVIWSIAVNEQQRILASCADDAMVKIWDVKKSICVTTTDIKEPVSAIAHLNKGNFIIGTYKGSLKVLNEKETRSIESHTTTRINTLCVLPDSFCASGSEDGVINIYDLSTGKHVQSLTGHQGSICALQLLPNGYLASASYDKTIKIWDMQEYKCVNTIPCHQDVVRSFTLLQDQLISVSDDKTIHVLSTNMMAKQVNIGSILPLPDDIKFKQEKNTLRIQANMTSAATQELVNFIELLFPQVKILNQPKLIEITFKNSDHIQKLTRLIDLLVTNSKEMVSAKHVSALSITNTTASTSTTASTTNSSLPFSLQR